MNQSLNENYRNGGCMNISCEHANIWKESEILLRPVGVIHSEHTIQDNTPIQGIFNPSIGYIEIFDEYVKYAEERLQKINEYTLELFA